MCELWKMFERKKIFIFVSQSEELISSNWPVSRQQSAAFEERRSIFNLIVVKIGLMSVKVCVLFIEKYKFEYT